MIKVYILLLFRKAEVLMFQKKGKVGVVWVIFFLISLLPFVGAEDGCFLYERSASYCSILSAEQARDECFGYDDCVFNEIFLEAKLCSQIPACDRILCKSSCLLEFRGMCSAGEISPQEQQSWCSPGCCAYLGTDLRSCSTERSEWHCQVDAYNAHADSYSFREGIDSYDCSSTCSNEMLFSSLDFEGTPSLKVSSFTKQTDSVLQAANRNVSSTFGDTKSNNSSSSSSSSLNVSSVFSELFWPIFLFLFIFGVSLVVFWWSRNRSSVSERFDRIVEDQERGLSFKSTDPADSVLGKFSLRGQKPKSVVLHKEALHRREQFMAEHNLATRKEFIPKPRTNFEVLDTVIKSRLRVNISSRKRKPEIIRDPWEKLSAKVNGKAESEVTEGLTTKKDGSMIRPSKAVFEELSSKAGKRVSSEKTLDKTSTDSFTLLRSLDRSKRSR